MSAKNQRTSVNAQLVFIEAANHVFEGKHPFEEEELPSHTNTIIELVKKSKEFLI